MRSAMWEDSRGWALIGSQRHYLQVAFNELSERTPASVTAGNIAALVLNVAFNVLGGAQERGPRNSRDRPDKRDTKDPI